MLQRGVEEEVQGGSGGGACDDVVLCVMYGWLLSASVFISEGLSTKDSAISRRKALSTAFGISALVSQAQPSFAGSAPPTQEELNRIKLGYSQIQYLLEVRQFVESLCSFRAS